MPRLGHLDQLLRAARILRRNLAFEIAQIEIIGGDRLEVLIPHDLGRDIGIVRIENWKRLPAT